MPLRHTHPPAIDSRISQMSWGLSSITENCPRNQRIPSLDSNGRTASVSVADNSHDKNTNSSCAISKTNTSRAMMRFNLINYKLYI